MKKTLVTVAALLLLASTAMVLMAIADRRLDTEGATGVPPIPDRLPVAAPPDTLRYSIIETAHTASTPEGLVVAGGDWLEMRRPVHAAVLVDHPDGRLLFDTGLGRDVDAQFRANNWLHRQLLAYEAVTPAADQLERHGMSADAIAFIVPSHMHWDHVSALEDFPGVPVRVPTAEKAFAEDGTPPSFLHSQFDEVDDWEPLTFEDGAYLGFRASLDLFGDGSVVLVPLPGHSAMQVGMFLTLPSGERLFFAADTAWAVEGLRWPAERSWLARKVLAVDRDVAANRRTLLHIHALMQAHPALRVVPAHDERVVAKLPRFPAYGQ